LLRYNLKIVTGIHIAAAVALLAATPVFFNLQLAAYNEVAMMGELFLSIIGIILVVPVCNIEERANCCEIVYVRRAPFVLQFLIRLAIVSVMVVLLQLVILTICKFAQGAFSLMEISPGVWITSFFLGMTGLTVSNITGDIKSGYLVAFAYYMFEFFTRGSYTYRFYIFSLLNASFYEKYFVLAVSAVMLTVNCVLVWKRSQP
jgi:hypothetical protein